MYEIYQVSARVYQRMGEQDLAIADLSKSAQYAATLIQLGCCTSYYRVQSSSGENRMWLPIEQEISA